MYHVGFGRGRYEHRHYGCAMTFGSGDLGASVTVSMAASPEVVWALVSDITRTGEFSPETLEAEWLNGATGPAEGNRFRGHVKRNGRGPMYWTECVVDVCEPETEFTITVVLNDRRMNTWSYKLAANDDGGTDVTESFALQDSLANRLYWTLLGPFRRKTNIANMTTTLERIRAVVEAE